MMLEAGASVDKPQSLEGKRSFRRVSGLPEQTKGPKGGRGYWTGKRVGAGRWIAPLDDAQIKAMNDEIDEQWRRIAAEGTYCPTLPGYTPLMAAATSNHVPVMMRLLEAGADWTWSAEKQRGWDPDEDDEGQCTTALECAQGKGFNHYSRSKAPGGAEAVTLLEMWAAEHPNPVRSHAFPPTTWLQS